MVFTKNSCFFPPRSWAGAWLCWRLAGSEMWKKKPFLKPVQKCRVGGTLVHTRSHEEADVLHLLSPGTTLRPWEIGTLGTIWRWKCWQPIHLFSWRGSWNVEIPLHPKRSILKRVLPLHLSVFYSMKYHLMPATKLSLANMATIYRLW